MHAWHVVYVLAPPVCYDSATGGRGFNSHPVDRTQYILSRYVGSRLCKPTVAQGLVDTVGKWKHGPA